MCLSLLHFHPCFVSEPNCNCCLSNKYTYMQLRIPEVTRVNFHLTINTSTPVILYCLRRIPYTTPRYNHNWCRGPFILQVAKCVCLVCVGVCVYLHVCVCSSRIPASNLH